ncbi:MAG: M48 family metalloprotease [Armatimonadetes bacterium]|nr:M48 family metalloprotease [Armatimonadota bacterium]
MAFLMAFPGNRWVGRRFVVPLVAVAFLGALPWRAAGSVERSVGKQAAEQLEEEIGVVADPALSLWVQRVGFAIVRADAGDARRFSFKILDADDVNAFALPGGYVYVTRGLLRFIDSEDELATVLGHEIAHVTSHHGSKQLKRDLLLSLALTLLRAHLPETVATVGEMGSVLYALRYSRGDERQADALGIQKAARAGFDPAAMVGFLRKLAEREKRQPSRFEIYFMTHPPTAERLERATADPLADARDPAARAAAARGLAARGLYRQAAARYEESLARTPGDAELHLAAAACWEALGRRAEAREERRRARALGARVSDPLPAALPAVLPPIPRSAAVAAKAELAKARESVSAGRARRARAIADTRRGLEDRKRRFRRLLGTLNTAAGSLSLADPVRQKMLQRIGLAVARLEKALGRVESIAEAAHTVPDGLAETAEALGGRLAAASADAEAVEIARAYEPAATRALAELDRSLGDCGKTLRLIDGALRACQVAAQDLAESALVPTRFLMIRYGQITSRIDAAASGAESAERAADAAGLLADAAEARRRVLALDLLGQQTPRPQRPASYALLVRRFGVPERQVEALAAGSAPLGRGAAALLLGMAVRVPLKVSDEPASPGGGKGAPLAADDRPVGSVTIEQAIERRVPLAPLNIALQSLGQDLARENEVAAPR